MKEKWKNLKIDVTLSAVLAILIGVLFVVWPGQITLVFARIIAVAVIVAGAVLLVGRVTDTPVNFWGVIGSAIVLLVGIWLFISPHIIASLLPIVIGVLLVVHGVQDLTMAAEAKRYQANRWWIAAAMGAVSIVFGIVCICNAFSLVKLTMVLIGVMLIYDGVSDMFIVYKVNRAAKNVVDSEVLREEDITDEM